MSKRDVYDLRGMTIGGEMWQCDTVREVFQLQIDSPLLAAFPSGEPPLAYFKFAPSVTEQSGRVVEDTGKLAQAEHRLDPAR